MKPLYDNVIVEVIEPENVTTFGIIITGKSVENVGKVVMVGKGKKLKNGSILPLDVKVGDKIKFEERAGFAIPNEGLSKELKGKKLISMREHEIIGVLEEQCQI